MSRFLHYGTKNMKLPQRCLCSAARMYVPSDFIMSSSFSVDLFFYCNLVETPLTGSNWQNTFARTLCHIHVQEVRALWASALCLQNVCPEPHALRGNVMITASNCYSTLDWRVVRKSSIPYNDLQQVSRFSDVYSLLEHSSPKLRCQPLLNKQKPPKK